MLEAVTACLTATAAAVTVGRSILGDARTKRANKKMGTPLEHPLSASPTTHAHVALLTPTRPVGVGGSKDNSTLAHATHPPPPTSLARRLQLVPRVLLEKG